MKPSVLKRDSAEPADPHQHPVHQSWPPPLDLHPDSPSPTQLFSSAPPCLHSASQPALKGDPLECGLVFPHLIHQTEVEYFRKVSWKTGKGTKRQLRRVLYSLPSFYSSDKRYIKKRRSFFLQTFGSLSHRGSQGAADLLS